MIPDFLKASQKNSKKRCGRWSPCSNPALSALILLAILMMLTLAGCRQSGISAPTIDASNETAAENGSPAAPQSSRPETVPSQAVEDLAVQVFAVEASLGENYYQYVFADLNNDGESETLVWLYGANFTSSSGDAMMILKSDGTLLQAFHTIHAPVTLSGKVHAQGLYRSFYMYSENGRYVRFDFDQRYPEIMELACEVDYDAVEGVVIFQSLEGEVSHPFLF